MSKGEDFSGPWNEGQSPLLQEEWHTIEDPLQHVKDTNGLLDEEATGTERTEKSVQSANKKLSLQRKTKVDKSNTPTNGILSWSVFEDNGKQKEKKKRGVSN